MGIFSKKNKEEKKPTSGQEQEPVEAVKKESMKDHFEEGKDKKAVKDGSAYKVLLKPLITEKAANLGSQNKYVFEVSIQANKIEIAKAIKEVYGIEPVSVNVVNVMGKNVRHGRINGRKRDWKKAVITLPAGKTINIYEGV
jgi:large subunit ribosomal protein L23